MTILDEILAHKRDELARARERCAPADALARARARRARAAARLPARARARRREPRVIAELKRRSPSRGEIRPDFEPVACARAYAEGGAAALSVLTDERYFGGHLELPRAVRAAVPLPLLRKDFVIDAYQVDEARVRRRGRGAADRRGARPRASCARCASARAALGLDALVEVHDERELDAALAAGADLDRHQQPRPAHASRPISPSPSASRRACRTGCVRGRRERHLHAQRRRRGSRAAGARPSSSEKR